MPSFVSSLIPRIEANALVGLNAGPGSIYPSYDGLSLVNLPASICHWLGAPTFGARPLADEILSALPGKYRHVILLVVDGLGLQQLEQLSQPGQPGAPASGRFAFWKRLLDQSVLAPITSIAPSTTASALTSLWTGQPAASHGIMGYEMFMKEYGVIANMITHSVATFTGDTGGLRRAGFDPEIFPDRPDPRPAPLGQWHPDHGPAACQHRPFGLIVHALNRRQRGALPLILRPMGDPARRAGKPCR